MATELDAAFDALVDSLTATADHLRQHPSFADPANQPLAYRFLMRMLLARIEGHLLFDPRQPYFHVLDHRLREGGDNSDQRYAIAKLDGTEAYRIWGTVRSERRVDVQIYANLPTDGQGRMAGFLDFEDLITNDDGSFEVIMSKTRRAEDQNWLELPDDATQVIVRQIYSAWSDGPRGDMHIDRLGGEGSVAELVNADSLAAGFRTAASELSRRAELWPRFVRGYVDNGGWNTMSPPIDPGRLGGVPGRWMCHAVWDLADDEALIVRTWPASGNYQGIQLTDMWFSSLEYANRQTSLSGDQAELSADGSYWFVVSATDPGVANWLDTMGLQQGVILLRFDGTGGVPLPEAHHPTAQKVRVADIASFLPDDTTRVTSSERGAALAARRRHVQIRYDC